MVRVLFFASVAVAGSYAASTGANVERRQVVGQQISSQTQQSQSASFQSGGVGIGGFGGMGGVGGLGALGQFGGLLNTLPGGFGSGWSQVSQQIFQFQQMVAAGGFSQTMAMQQIQSIVGGFQNVFGLMGGCGACGIQGGMVNQFQGFTQTLFSMFTQSLTQVQSTLGMGFMGQIAPMFNSLVGGFQQFGMFGQQIGLNFANCLGGFAQFASSAFQSSSFASSAFGGIPGLNF